MGGLFRGSFWSRRIYSPYSCVFRRRLQDVFKTTWSRRIYSYWWYVFKSPSRCFQDVLQKRLQDVLKTCSRRLDKSPWRHLQDVLASRLEDVFKTSSRRLGKMFSRHIIRLVFSSSLRRTGKTIIYRKIFLGCTFEKFMGGVQHFQEWTLWIYRNF